MTIEARIEQLANAVNRLNETMDKLAQTLASKPAMYAPLVHTTGNAAFALPEQVVGKPFTPVEQPPAEKDKGEYREVSVSLPVAPSADPQVDNAAAVAASAPAHPSFEDLSKAVQKAALAGHKDGVRKLLAQYKVARGGDIPEDQRAAFIADVNALGAK